MHEASILQYTLAGAERIARANGLKQLTMIRLSHGKLRGIYEPAMHKLFAIMKNSDSSGLLAECQLELEEIPVEIECLSCGGYAQEPSGTSELICPFCGRRNVSLRRGNELMLSEIRGC